MQLGVHGVFNMGAPAERVADYETGLVSSGWDAAHALQQLIAFHAQLRLMRVWTSDPVIITSRHANANDGARRQQLHHQLHTVNARCPGSVIVSVVLSLAFSGPASKIRVYNTI